MLLAQTSTPADTAKPAPATTVQLPPIDFSGVLFGNFQYRGDKAAKGQNKFDVERTYLTFKMPAGDRASIRVTTDIYQQTSSTNNADAYYKGWAVRLKYAYANYTFLKSDDLKIDGRVGIVQTAVIDQVEQFWPRYISQTAVERAGFFSSADMGAASFVALPNKMGELYVGVANGPGYASREVDRFKDYSTRLSITPLANNSDAGLLKNLTLLGYYYKGTLASSITGVGNGLKRDRWGVFAGIKDPRLTIGGDFDQRMDEKDAGVDQASRVVSDSTLRLASIFALVKPFQLMDKNGLPLGLIARYDHVKPNTATDPSYFIFIGGLTWDLNKKFQFALDYQEQTPRNGATVTPTKTYFAHWIANF